MWSRRELKQRAKYRLRKNYMSMVFVALIFMLVMNAQSYYNVYFGDENTNTAVSSVSSMSNMTNSSSISNYFGMFSGARTKSDEYFSHDEEETTGESQVDSSNVNPSDVLISSPVLGDLTYEQLMNMSQEELWATYKTYFAEVFSASNLKTALPFTAFWFLFYLLISNAVEVGCCAFFVDNTKDMEENVGIKEIMRGFKLSYLRNVVTLFLRDIKVFLWTMLLFVPGIVKSLEYRMVPFLLAEYPEMTRKEAFRCSKELMRGEKWDALILDFSFILWAILDSITGGLAGIVWVNPYQMATNAELYQKLKELKGFYFESV